MSKSKREIEEWVSQLKLGIEKVNQYRDKLRKEGFSVCLLENVEDLPEPSFIMGDIDVMIERSSIERY